MKKRFLKLIILITSFMATSPMLIAYADEKSVFKNISNAILSVLLWFAFAIAVGVMIFGGIKYLMSGADERANLKGMFSKYLIGIALIVLSFTIASGIAELAGNDTAPDIVEVGKEAGNHFVGNDDENPFEGSYAVGGTPENPYLNVEKTNNYDGTYTETVTGSNRNGGTSERTYTYDGDLVEEIEYDSDGNMTSKTTYDEEGVYDKKLYSDEYLTVNDFIYGEVTDALRTQDNGYRLLAEYRDTNGDGRDDMIYYTDIDGTSIGDGEVLYDEQGRIWRLFRTEYVNGVYGEKSKEVYTQFNYNEDGSITIENIDALATSNNQRYKYDIVTNNSGHVKSSTYSEYVVDFWSSDYYEEVGTTYYNASTGPRN